MSQPLLEAIALALGLGLLVGLQRERVGKRLAGIRTFPLVTLFGVLSAALARETGAPTLPAGLLALAALIAVERWLMPARRPSGEAPSPAGGDDEYGGSTTEVALLVMFAVGALLMYGQRAAPLAIVGAVVVLLYAKQPLHRFVHELGEQDITAIVRFVIIALIVLPLLPNRAYGPLQVLNPFQIWLMVVLIVGLNLTGYIASRLFGARAGTLLNGLFGGLLSSTATSASYARQARFGSVDSAAAALVVAIASTLVYLRVGFELLVVAPQLGAAALLPFGLLLAVGAATCALAYRRLREPSGRTKAPTPQNPAELLPALLFGALYGAVILTTAAAKHGAGDGALYLVALIAGLTDVDAITLSTARLAHLGQIEADTAWRVVVTAVLANLGFKLAVVAALSGRVLTWPVARLFAPPMLTGLALLWLWPD